MKKHTSNEIPWPSKKELKKVMKVLRKSIGSRVLPPDATPIDKLKDSICAEFIIYKQNHNLTQKQLAEKLDIDEALMSKVLHYHFDEFTLDRLIRYLNIIYPKMEFNLKVSA